jgi:aminoglycoside phosphotransferase (APT) family kinase protein
VLEHSDVARHLLSLGLLDPAAVVEEDLAIVDASRRNRVFVAARRGGPALVVKQCADGRGDTLAHEAAVLRALGGHPGVAGHVPAVVHHDPRAGTLVLRTPGGARDWSAQHARGRFGPALARALGRVLAALHGLPEDAVERLPPVVDQVWALSLEEPPHELVRGLSSGAQELLALLQGSADLCRRLRDLGEDLAPDGMAHGDLRWDNCLAVAASGSARRTRVLVIDWELAGAGPAALDLGTVLGEYLRVWVESIPIADAREPARLMRHAARPLAWMQPAMAAFWSAYRIGRGGAPRLRRVVELAAVRLLQAAVERAQSLSTPSPHVIGLVQVADNMLRDPHAGARHLLALRE